MQQAENSGIFLLIQKWLVILPLHDNDNHPFPAELIMSLIDRIRDRFPDFTLQESKGNYLRDDQEQQDDGLKDDGLMLTIDLPVGLHSLAAAFFWSFKRYAARILNQDEIYVTCQPAGQRLLLPEEFERETRKARSLYGYRLPSTASPLGSPSLPALPAPRRSPRPASGRKQWRPRRGS